MKTLSLYTVFKFLFLIVCTSHAHSVMHKGQKANSRPTNHGQPIKKTESKPQKKAEQNNNNDTLVIYMAGDGDLEPYVDITRKQCEREGVPDNLNVILCVCTHRANEPKVATITQVKGNKSLVLEKLTNIDSGDKKSLLRACMTSIKRFGKGNFHLVLWDHSYGRINRMPRRGICYDAATGNFLTDSDLRDVCAEVKKELGKNISMLGCDACLMACGEIGYAIKESVDYLLASEQTIPVLGWPYHLLIKSYKKSGKNTEKWSAAQVVNYRDYYDMITQDYTLSLVNLRKLGPLLENLKAITTALNQLITQQQGRSVISALHKAGNRTTRFEEQAYADLYDWYQQILLVTHDMSTKEDSEGKRLIGVLRKMLADGTALVNQAVIKSVQGALISRARGIFAYVPQKNVDRDYANCLWAKDNPQWLQLLNSICSH